MGQLPGKQSRAEGYLPMSETFLGQEQLGQVWVLPAANFCLSQMRVYLEEGGKSGRISLFCVRKVRT